MHLPPLLYVTLCSSFLLKYVFITAISILFAKSTTICPSTFLSLTPYLPITSSSSLFPSPTCPLKSAPITTLSYLGTLTNTSSNLLQKSSFSSISHPTCGAYALMTFIITPSISSFTLIILSDTLFTSNTLFTYSSFRITSTPFLFPSTPW